MDAPLTKFLIKLVLSNCEQIDMVPGHMCQSSLYGLNLGQHIQTVKAELWLKPFTEAFPVYCQILSPLVCLSMPEASILTKPEFYAH
jgi:hypothetical protein